MMCPTVAVPGNFDAVQKGAGENTIAAVISAAAERLRGAGVPEPRRDAQVLLGYLLGCDRGYLIGYSNEEIGSELVKAFGQLIARRAAREPISHLVGAREFWSLRFKVTSAVLDPRPDSETLVESILAEIPDRNLPLSLLDIGTGSGCLLLALLSELSQAKGIGADRSCSAVAIAIENARALGLAARANFSVGDWASELAGRFNVIVSNPPYIARNELEGLLPEVARYEPRIALDGGSDGLGAYRRLAVRVKQLLEPGGIAGIEIGAGQANAVSALLSDSGLAVVRCRCDLGGRERCLLVRHEHEKNGWKSQRSEVG